MKNTLLSIAALLVLFLNACKKDGNKPSAPVTDTPKPLTTAQMLVGKWTIVKDSVQVFDFRTPLTNPQNLVLGKSDFVVFNGDNTATVSSQVGFDALYTDYGKFYINPGENVKLPNFTFNYQVTPPANELPATLGIPNLALGVSVGYDISQLNSTSLVLHNENIIAKYPHEYVIKRDIYLSK